MRHTVDLCLLSLHLLSLINLPLATQSKSVIEPCNSKDPCTALLAYRLPWASTFSDIAYRFQVNLSDILASNNLNPTKPLSRNFQILPSKFVIKIPISCHCADGIRRSLSTVYSVRPADTVESISDGYGGLVSADQIRAVNGVNESNPLVTGQRIVVPLPCTCFNNMNSGATVVYVSYVVEKGENLGRIAAEYGTTVKDLEAVNGLGQGRIRRRDILAVPLPACSSANLDWRDDESLVVPNGSYALTANSCIKCSCDPTDLSLQCWPSGMAASCTHLQCKGSDLFIGQTYEKRTDLGCNVTACVYRGHSGSKIFNRVLNYSHIQCTGNKTHLTSSSPFTSLPLTSPSPSPSLAPPSSASHRPIMVVPTRKHSTTSSGGSKRLRINEVSCVDLLLLELALSLIL